MLRRIEPCPETGSGIARTTFDRLSLTIEGMDATVLIVDDHAGFRRGAKDMLEGGGFLVIGEAPTLESARSTLRLLHPDLVLLDIRLPDGTGFELAAELALLPRSPTVVLTSSRDAHDYGDRLVSCGAHGFIAKHELTPDALRSFT